MKKKKWGYRCKKMWCTEGYEVVSGNVLGDDEGKKGRAFLEKKKVCGRRKKRGKGSERRYGVVVNEGRDERKVNKGG
ncbi:hypothetical protein, partial [Bacillus altitudinis]|uniref:hypothetical protein n=1 Tax=Bacillus altitudinis TaxID=293387 RepID=UPI0011A77E07